MRRRPRRRSPAGAAFIDVEPGPGYLTSHVGKNGRPLGCRVVVFVAGVAVAQETKHRVRAVAAAGRSPDTDPVVEVEQVPDADKAGRSRELLDRMREVLAKVLKHLEEAREERDVIKLNCVNESSPPSRGSAHLRAGDVSMQEALAPPQREVAQHEFEKLSIAATKCEQLLAESEACVGELSVYAGETQVEVEIEGEPPRISPRTFRRSRSSLARRRRAPTSSSPRHELSTTPAVQASGDGDVQPIEHRRGDVIQRQPPGGGLAPRPSARMRMPCRRVVGGVRTAIVAPGVEVLVTDAALRPHREVVELDEEIGRTPARRRNTSAGERTRLARPHRSRRQCARGRAAWPLRSRRPHRPRAGPRARGRRH